MSAPTDARPDEPSRARSTKPRWSRRRWFLVGGLVLGGLAALGAAALVYKKTRRWTPEVAPSERSIVLAAMAARPDDVWPRGQGHVLLAWPGSRAADKGYHEPGGSFSPGVGSFGLAVGIAEANGELTTSDSVALDSVTQRFEATENSLAPPALVDSTPLYDVSWTTPQPGEFSARLERRAAGDPVLVVRSVGPAGGPVHRLRHDGEKLWIDERWSLEFDPPPSHLRLVDEPTTPEKNWLSRGETPRPGQIDSFDGWAAARLDFVGAAGVTVRVRDSWPVAPLGLTVQRFDQTEVTVPDRRFVNALQAQVAHLTMSVVGTATRPGEPTNYPLEWLRDGAYVVTALARAGHVELATRLSTHFSERDFFGGFGPEGENPAFAIWVLDEVSRARGRNPDVDTGVYPHVFRKAKLIEQLLDTRKSVFVLPLESPIVPSWRDDRKVQPSLALVAESAQNGLVRGRMDGHVPLLFVNAINYLGLVRAASFAENVGDAPSAAHWSARAATLRQAWQRGFATDARYNERTFISSMWPSFVSGTDRAPFIALMKERQKARAEHSEHVPWPNPWSYFDVGEMHQWVELGDVGSLWQMLDFYLENSTSRGLYTWGEGFGEENSYGLWQEVRGWVKPGQVTPHYWTAAEMLLLQLEMLAFVDETDPTKPRWVLGAGVPPSWLDSPLDVKRVGATRGRVDWSWDPTTKRVKATILGDTAEVVLGPSFPEDAQLELNFAP